MAKLFKNSFAVDEYSNWGAQDALRKKQGISNPWLRSDKC